MYFYVGIVDVNKMVDLNGDGGGGIRARKLVPP